MALDRKKFQFAKKEKDPVNCPDANILIDVCSVGFASYFGVKEKLQHDGVRTDILYGFLDQLMTFYKLFRSTRMVFCFDSKMSIRKQKYPWYKKRPPSNKGDDDEHEKEMNAIYTQFNILKNDVLPKMGFKNIVYQRGIESDDLIASIVMNNEGQHIVISSDKDLYQLLNNCSIYDHRKKVMVTKKILLEKYALTPEQWLEFKRIGGCSSDKVPGIPGIGEKTTLAYLKNELRAGKKLDSIIEDMAKDKSSSVYGRNSWLVTLPIPGTKKVKLSFENQELSESGFGEVCSEYAFRFLDKMNRGFWLKMLNESV